MTNTEKVNYIREGVNFLARIWKQNMAPVEYEESVFVDGKWVKVKIGYDKKRNDITPLRRKEDKAKADE